MSRKFIDLTQLTTPATNDLLPIHDASAGSTKKITVLDLLNTPGIIGTLGYTQVTNGASTTSASDVQATGLTVTVTIPAGGRRIKITAFARSLSNTSTDANVHWSIWDGPVGTGTQLAGTYVTIPVATGLATGMAIAVVTPAAGSKTYNVGISQNGGGTASFSAETNHPAFILVEAI